MTTRELLHLMAVSKVTLTPDADNVHPAGVQRMTMPQVDNLQYGNMEDYCDVYHLDTAVIIWKAEDVEGANRARDYIKSLTLDDIEVGMYYTAGFGPLSGFVFFAFGVDGAR